MMAVDRVCPSCGAVQRPEAAPAEEHTFAMRPPACPRCGRPLLPGATYCAYCGAPGAGPATANSRVASFLSWMSGLCSALAIAGLCPPLFGLLAASMALRAQALAPRHWVPPFLVGAAIAATVIGMLVWFVRLANGLGQGLV